MKFNYLRLPDLPKDERKLVGFMIENVSYGLPIMSINEVINPGKITVVPSLPRFVVGITEHRNNVIPIINLRARFGLPDKELNGRTKWIIAVIDKKQIGIQVDTVTEVVTVDSSMQKDRPILTVKGEPWIVDIFQVKGVLIFEINLPALIEEQVFFPVSDKESS